ncbi:YifB family Mg chelatase-like AAA ATPase [Nigerium massiliense]|uniref:YifB family Mg chelatase-like AAA ATPase n=1 Tax=Nigerium massiliense TaxID=1522317 RepID=UPI0009078DDE|nr:YifB family Mg chelatase-like AAA ATPase [Nigerium massiliense]
MRIAQALSVALVGLEATVVEVEVSIGGGLPRTVIVGLPDAALYEARDRCKAAITSLDRTWPNQAVTINLTPATLPKAGSHFDLAIVVATLAAERAVPPGQLKHTVFLGELGLDGRVRGVRGVLPALLAAQRQGCDRAVVPVGQLGEARLVEGLRVHGVSSLADVLAVLQGRAVSEPDRVDEPAPPQFPRKDLADVVGQLEGKWALEVAAAGGHHLYLHGPPGVGKTLLAERLPSILPDLSVAESLEVSALHSLAGRPLDGGLVTRPPFAAPHHSASLAALVGGGARIAQPGAVSHAHCGVLFLDEAPEFSPRALEALRTPLESGVIVLARSLAQTTYPARFQLVLAANPCPCGLAGTPGAQCRCSPMAVRRYSERISGPILDRIDIQQGLRPLRQSFLAAAAGAAEASAAVAARVAAARDRQRHRLAPLSLSLNSAVPGRVLRRELPLPQGFERLDRAVSRGLLSARGIDKVVRLAWTIADLAGEPIPTPADVDTALAMRRGEQVEARCG